MTSVFELVLYNEPLDFFEFRKEIAQLRIQENLNRNSKTLWVTYDANGMTYKSFKEIKLNQYKNIFEPENNVIIYYNLSYPEYFYIDGLKNRKTYYFSFFFFLALNVLCYKFIQGLDRRISRYSPRISQKKVRVKNIKK
ncbi:hypothetical protein E1140_08410 [Fulvivirga lutimaris]|nr:hypothetical protein [Fulvivirga lutimaris]